MGTDLAHHPTQVKQLGWPKYYDDSGDEFDAPRGSVRQTNSNGGRIILLGDGTEVLSDSDDAEMVEEGEKDDEALEKQKAPAKDTMTDGDDKKESSTPSNGTSEVVVPKDSSR